MASAASPLCRTGRLIGRVGAHRESGFNSGWNSAHRTIHPGSGTGSGPDVGVFVMHSHFLSAPPRRRCRQARSREQTNMAGACFDLTHLMTWVALRLMRCPGLGSGTDDDGLRTVSHESVIPTCYRPARKGFAPSSGCSDLNPIKSLRKEKHDVRSSPLPQARTQPCRGRIGIQCRRVPIHCRSGGR